MLRTYLLAFCITAGGSLQAQWADRTRCGQNGMVCKRVEKKTVVSVSGLPDRVYPWGEMQLHRLKRNVFEFDINADKDTIEVLVTSKDGVPFKRVQWDSGDSSTAPKPNSNVYHWKGVFKGPTRASLRIVPAFSLNKQVAIIHIRRYPPNVADTLLQITDTLRVSGKKAVLGIESRQYAAPFAGSRQLSSWNFQYQPMPGFPNLESQHGTLLISPKPSLETVTQMFVRLRRTRLVPLDGFQADDTLIISMSAKEPIQRITLLTEDKQIVNQVRNVSEWNDTLVINEGQKFFVLRLHDNISLLKKYIDISVKRIRPVKPAMAYMVSDTMYAMAPVTYKYDTLLVTIADDSLVLSPIWDIEHEPYGQIEVQIPDAVGKGYQLLSVAYWIGIGRNAINAFSQLESTVPPEWSMPGASVALGAFALEKVNLLPPSGKTDVLCTFLPERRKVLVKREVFSLPKPLNKWPGQRYAKVLRQSELNEFTVAGTSLATGTASRNFFACFQNTSTVSTWPVSVKVVGCYRKTTALPAGEPQLVKATTDKIPLLK